MKLGYTRAADGTKIAYRVRGEGPPLVLCNGLTTSEFFWRYLLPRWSAQYQVVTWDYKGHGDSGAAQTAEGATVRQAADDLVRVMDALDIEQAPVVSYSMGCQVVLEACRSHIGRFDAVALLLGPAGRVFDTAFGPVGKMIENTVRLTPDWALPAFKLGLHGLMRGPFVQRLGQHLKVIGPDTPRADVRRYIEHFGRLDAQTVARLARDAGQHDASDVLRQFGAPLLIVAGDNDVFAPSPVVGEVMHAETNRQADFVRLPHGTHTSLFEHPDDIAKLIRSFLNRRAVSGLDRVSGA